MNNIKKKTQSKFDLQGVGLHLVWCIHVPRVLQQAPKHRSLDVHLLRPIWHPNQVNRSCQQQQNSTVSMSFIHLFPQIVQPHCRHLDCSPTTTSMAGIVLFLTKIPIKPQGVGVAMKKTSMGGSIDPRIIFST